MTRPIIRLNIQAGVHDIFTMGVHTLIYSIRVNWMKDWVVWGFDGLGGMLDWGLVAEGLWTGTWKEEVFVACG